MGPMLLQLLKKFGDTFGKIPGGWAGIILAALIAALGLALNRVDHWKGEATNWQNRSVMLELRLAFEQSKADTVRIPGNYEVDTLWREIVHIDTIGGRICTTAVPCPEISGVIAIDTTRQYGPKANPFGIRVAGRFYWPERDAHRNWMVIDVQGWKDPPYLPVEARSVSRYAIGPAAFAGPGAGAALGLQARVQRLTLFGGYNVVKRSFAAGIGCELLRF